MKTKMARFGHRAGVALALALAGLAVGCAVQPGDGSAEEQGSGVLPLSITDSSDVDILAGTYDGNTEAIYLVHALVDSMREAAEARDLEAGALGLQSADGSATAWLAGDDADVTVSFDVGDTIYLVAKDPASGADVTLGALQVKPVAWTDHLPEGEAATRFPGCLLGGGN